MKSLTSCECKWSTAELWDREGKKRAWMIGVAHILFIPGFQLTPQPFLLSNPKNLRLRKEGQLGSFLGGLALPPQSSRRPNALGWWKDSISYHKVFFQEISSECAGWEGA